jgi:hypothetical protein
MMASDLEQDERLQAALTSIQRIAIEIAAMSRGRRRLALGMVRKVYYQSMLDSGFAEAEAKELTIAIMDKLRSQVLERDLAKNKLKALHDELIEWLKEPYHS